MGGANLEQTRTAISSKWKWATLVPYGTIGIGLLGLHNVWFSILGYHLGMIIVLLLAGPQISFRQVWRSRNYEILIVTSAFGGMGGLLLYLFWPLLGIPGDISQYLQNRGLTTAAWPFFLAYFILVNPWLEEYFWRSYLGSNSKNLTLNDLLFSGYHILVLVGVISVVWIIMVFVVLCMGAWFWRQANRWNQGLLASVVSHLAADATVIFAIYFMTAM